MKAKDYFDKYGEAIQREAMDCNTETALAMFVEFCKEVNDITAQRHVKTDRAAIAVIKEVNQKWNKLANLFEADCGCVLLKRNALLDYFVENIPEIKELL